MAHAALVSLIQSIEDLIPLHEEITRSIHEKASSLLALLEDSPPKFGQSLEGRIRDAAYQAQHIIDSYMSVQIKSEFEFIVTNPFSKLISTLANKIMHGHHPSVETTISEYCITLQKVIDQFDSILVDLSMIEDGNVVDLLQLKNSVSAGSSNKAASKRITLGLVECEVDMLCIKERLTESSSQLKTIPIVGMGGIGKTTLAQSIYNDPLIDEYFEILAWTTISQGYSVKKMVTDLLGSIRHVSVELGQDSIEKLQLKLYQNLFGRRYLIVVDDIWDTVTWDDLNLLLPDDHKGNRIILTTRHSHLASYVDSGSPIHQMKLLTMGRSWNLFLEKVFGETFCPPELKKIGEKIVHNCQGLPLAIVVIGGLLSKAEETQESWQRVAENLSSAITGTDDHFSEILSLSYYHLPQHLKACFLYMGVFPEDKEIHVTRLIKLWVAEGFLKPIGNKSLEEVANDNLKDLIDRSLIMVGRLKFGGEIKTCIIHDLLRDLCIKKAEVEKLIAIIKNDSWLHPEGIKNQHRVSIQFCVLEYPKFVTNSHVRSLLHFGESYSLNCLLYFTVNFTLLRVLNTLSISFNDFPIQIVELVNLRFLAFNCNKSKLSPSISKLRNLQTLIVYGGFAISPIHTFSVPSVIWNMPQLRHIVFERCILFCPSSARIDDYTNLVPLKFLQTLMDVCNFSFTKEVFQIMPNLRKLVISYTYDSCTKWSSYDFSSFVHLQQLEILKCCFDVDSFDVLRPLKLNFAFPGSLKKLTLSGCSLPWEQLTIVGSLPNIEVLKLKNYAFRGRVWVPNEGEFCSLKSLVITQNFLEDWIANDTHFPNSI